MATTEQAEKSEIKLSCREAQLILQLTSLRKNTSEMEGGGSRFDQALRQLQKLSRSRTCRHS